MEESNKITQEIYSPNGQLIFKTDNPLLLYDESILNNMAENGYLVKINGRKKRGKRQ